MAENLQETSLYDEAAAAEEKAAVTSRQAAPCGSDSCCGGAPTDIVRTCSADVETPMCACVDVDGQRRLARDKDSSAGQA